MQKCVWQLFVNKVLFAGRWKIDNMKKNRYVILAACVVVVLAVACSGTGNLKSKLKSETEVTIETEQTETQEMIETTAEVKSTEIISIVTKKSSYDTTDGHLLNYQIYEYDNKGNVIKENWFNGDGELVDVYDYSYTYDSKGNVAKMAFKGRYEDEVILKWLKNFYHRFFIQQFKRSCVPDGPKVGSVALSPRGDWRMPSDASARIWKEELEAIGDGVCGSK